MLVNVAKDYIFENITGLFITTLPITSQPSQADISA